MVNELELSGEELKARFAQRARAELPFNPVDVNDITGENVERLQKSMKSFGWHDPRFITKAQATANGWTLKPKAESVEIQVRNEANGLFDTVALVNGENVRGMPSLAAMLVLSDEAFQKMRGTSLAIPSLDVDEELSIGPARALTQDIEPDWFGPNVLRGTADPLDTEFASFKARQANNPALLQPGFKLLASHGAAPYLNDPKNTASYYVSLDDGRGELETVWGVDLERSLGYAGVRIDDAIALARNGNRVVEIDEKQADGSVVKKSVERVNWDVTLQPLTPVVAVEAGSSGIQQPAGGRASSAAIEGGAALERFAAMAPYWLDGLHNAEGLALARKINLEIKSRALAEDREAIARLMVIHSKARTLGLGVVPEMQYLNDPDLKRNRAEPNSLLDGALVRDKEGAYHPKMGGRTVIQDHGDSLVLKSKTAEAYRGAMELAVAKGWKAIELKGSKAMLSDAWVEAKMLGLEVVGYAPNEKDHAKYAARVAEESKLKEPVHVRPLEQAAERVEVRPFVDATGQEKLATMTYTVSYQGGVDAEFGNAKDAAKAFAGLSSADSPVVVRSVIRADGVVTEGVVAGMAQGVGKGGLAQVSEKILDHEFDDAMDVIVANENAQASLKPGLVDAVASGMHFGPIVAIEGDRVAQKTGRQIVWHDVAKLKGAVPKVGEMAEIGYAKGLGIIKKKALEAELDGGGRGLER